MNEAQEKNISTKNDVIPAISVHLKEIEAFYAAIFSRRKEMPAPLRHSQENKDKKRR
ncbi:hypothetical protein [Paenibacillus macerans]|uniref:hypothetical protein n=1 Tax=Paenibacillus macerans TaxID=44252 RepID=UPI000AAA3F74|nr:hypothetical protein [Paenibacillus macerans]MCY7561773.1 hypothetical protein [Paenibacillus macerans]MEC0154923.1 hypothetical protein [Paenibacillus macerans]SUA83195.1 Uncharacterised protein [Paenibacillus macerans]